MRLGSIQRHKIRQHELTFWVLSVDARRITGCVSRMKHVTPKRIIKIEMMETTLAMLPEAGSSNIIHKDRLHPAILGLPSFT
jgi:hypothetical protein